MEIGYCEPISLAEKYDLDYSKYEKTISYFPLFTQTFLYSGL